MRAGVALATIALVGASLWYVTAPPRDEGAYRHRAANAATKLRAQVETATLWAGGIGRGDVLAATAKVGLADAARAADGTAARFSAYDPPRGTDAVRNRFVRLAADTTDTLGVLRIVAADDVAEWSERIVRLRRGAAVAESGGGRR